MMEKEQERESSLPKYESDYGEHGPIPGKPPDQDHGQPKKKRPPPDPADFEHNDDSPPCFDRNNSTDVEEKGCTPPGVDMELGDQPQSSRMEDIAGLPHRDHPSLTIDNLSPWEDGMEEEEKLSRPTNASLKIGLALPKSLSSQLDEKFSQPSSLSSKDGGVHLPSFPDVEGDIMQAVEIPTTHLSEGEQFSMPKSLTSKLDKIRVKRVSRRPLNRNKFTRASGVQCGGEVQYLRMEVDRLKAMMDRNESGGLDGANADKRGTIPWQIYVYDDLKKMLVEIMACLSITMAVGYICGRNK